VSTPAPPAAATGSYPWIGRIPVALAALTILLQIAYPLVSGALLDRLTVVTVVVFFSASVSHALLSRGPGFTGALVAVTAGGGFIVEALGVNLGLPFGAYAYTGTLGAEVLGVPVIIPLAWTMMGYPALLVGGRITRHAVGGPVAAALALATWDLFLDPQMVDAGHWVWLGGGPMLLDIPLSNFAGWVVTAVLMMALLWRVPGAHGNAADDGATARRRTTDAVMYVLYLWVYLSSVMAHAVFFDLPASALVGGVGMGAVVAAFLWALRR
jgi:carotene biosynthesis associated membrane protein